MAGRVWDVRRAVLLSGCLLGLLATTIGDEIALVSLTVRFAGDQNAGLLVAGLMASAFAPAIVLGTIFGRVVDRYDRPKVLVATCVLQTLVAWAMVATAPSWLLLCLAVGLGSLVPLFSVTMYTLLPMIVGQDSVGTGNAVVEGMRNIGFLIGPALGGLIVAGWGWRSGLVVNAASFMLVGAASIALVVNRRHAIRSPGTPAKQDRARSSVQRDVLMIWRDKIAAATLGPLFVAIGATSILNVALIFFVRGALHQGAQYYGVLVSAWGLGMVVGPPLLSRYAKSRAALSELAFAGGVAIGAVLLLTTGEPWPPILALLFVVGGIGNSAQNIAILTLLADRFPGSQHGRAYGGYSAFKNTAVLAGFIAGGLGAPSSSRLLLFISGATTLTSALVGLAVFLGIRSSYPNSAVRPRFDGETEEQWHGAGKE